MTRSPVLRMMKIVSTVRQSTKKLDILVQVWYPGYTMIEKGIMDTVSELKKFDAVLRMTRFSTKRKGNDKKRISKKLCRKKVRF